MLVAVLAVCMGPEAAYALSPSDNGTPPAPSSDRLPRAWAREQRIYDRLGRFFDNADGLIAKAQNLIDRARANGKDVSTVQAALDVVSSAVKQARPDYESGKGIVASHQGFDAAGNVTDPTKALETVQDMRTKLQSIRQDLMPSVRVLREAVRAFRQANRPAATPAP
jgi:hypothetical protein